MNSPYPRTWVLLGHRRGDNNQLLALGEALGVPFETRTLSYRRSARPIMRLWPRSIDHLTSESRSLLTPPWPDLVVGIGRRSVPVARWIREKSGGRAGLVRLGNPRAPSAWFDLVMTTPQYPVEAASNVLTLPLALNRFRHLTPPNRDEQAFFDALPRPHILLSLGGNAPMWRIDPKALRRDATTLLERAVREKGSLIIAPSPRTPSDVLDDMRSLVSSSPAAQILDSGCRYGAALADADLHAVTADSISMISEAIATGKPVAMIPVEPNRRGMILLGSDPDDTRSRDPRRFWNHIEALGLAGTVEQPRSGDIPDPVAIAVEAVRSRFPKLFAR